MNHHSFQSPEDPSQENSIDYDFLSQTEEKTNEKGLKQENVEEKLQKFFFGNDPEDMYEREETGLPKDFDMKSYLYGLLDHKTPKMQERRKSTCSR